MSFDFLKNKKQKILVEDVQVRLNTPLAGCKH